MKLDTKHAQKVLDSLINHVKDDPALKNDKNIIISITTTKKMGMSKDNVPRIVPIKAKINKPKDLKILLVTKDPVTSYKETLSNHDATSELFTDIIGIKNLKKRYRGSKLTELYRDCDLIVADYRVHHLLPAILGSRFMHGNKKVPFVIKLSRTEVIKRQPTSNDCDPIYVRAQVRNIAKNTYYIPNSENSISVKIGILGKHSTLELVQNITEVVNFLSDKSKKPQGGILKGEIQSIIVKTVNSASLPLFPGP